MRGKQYRSGKGRQDPSLTREAEAIVVQLTEKVLEHGLNSTAVHGVPAGCGQQLNNWICVRKKREKRRTGRQRETERRRQRERENCKRLDFLPPHSCLALEHPAVKGRPPLAESSGPGYHHPLFPHQAAKLEPTIKVKVWLAMREQLPASPPPQ